MSDDAFTNAGGANGTTHTPGKHRGPRFSWTTEYEATFFRSLCESDRLGLREGSTFKAEAWERAIQALIKHHNQYAHKTHLINKSDNARKKFRLWRGLREDPEFRYDRVSRTVTASEDAWKRHIEKEPLSRSLKGRPFDHEEYYEILFPDVIGSGGAPKRLTKPRRKDADGVNGLGDPDAPGTAMMDILGESTYGAPTQTHIAPPVLPPTTAVPSNIGPPPQQHTRANGMPPRASIGSSSALTPPEDPSLHSRKRFQPPLETISLPAVQQEKRRRVTATSAIPSAPVPQQYIDLSQTAPSAPMLPSNNTTVPAPAPPPPGTPSTLPGTVMPEGVGLLAEALRTAVKTKTTWSEQAVEIFFRDFVEEDMDLQLKIAEKILTDESKAMVFCKMPEILRQHWVRRLREMHNQRMG